MSGFVWPSAAPGAPQPLSVSQSSAMSQSGQSQPPASSSAMSPISSASSSKSRRTKYVQVTRAVTVTPPSTMTAPGDSVSSCTDKHPDHSDYMSKSIADRSSRSAPPLTTHVKVTRTITRSPAAEVTGVDFQMLNAPDDSSQVTGSSQPTDSIHGDGSKPGGVNHAAVIGGIAGVLGLLCIIIVYIAYLRKKRMYGSKRPDAESGRALRNPYRATDDVINEGRRLRQERHKRNRESGRIMAHNWNGADTIELMHQNNAIAAQQHVHNARGAGAPPCGMDQVQLAQAHAWETPFAADTFQTRKEYPSRISVHRGTRRPPPIVTRPPKASRQHSQRAQVGGRSRSPVSPLPGSHAAPRGSRGNRSFSDVSPLVSPVQSRSRAHGWAR